jgi:hypothetical protein
MFLQQDAYKSYYYIYLTCGIPPPGGLINIAGGGTRTLTRAIPRRILSPLRLPIPPLRHCHSLSSIISLDFYFVKKSFENITMGRWNDRMIELFNHGRKFFGEALPLLKNVGLKRVVENERN